MSYTETDKLRWSVRDLGAKVNKLEGELERLKARVGGIEEREPA